MKSINSFGAVIMALLIGSSAMYAQRPFGMMHDIDFANSLWQAIDGYQDWIMKSGVYPGKSPHGDFLRTYYSMVSIDGKSYHCIVKDNYAGDGATAERVFKDPESYLAAVTVMVQREQGYDTDNQNWYWVKYGADGTMEKNRQGMSLAGRVTNCITCHNRAKGGDFLFSNDK